MGHAPEPRDSPPPDPAAAGRFVTLSVVGRVRVVALDVPVEIDSDAFDALNVALMAEVDTVGTGACVLDLTRVEYMGSSMLGLVVNVRQRSKAAGGRLVLCGLSDWLVQTFRTCSLERLFVTATTQEAAVKLAGRR